VPTGLLGDEEIANWMALVADATIEHLILLQIFFDDLVVGIHF
jgi:hypothetical protein